MEHARGLPRTLVVLCLALVLAACGQVATPASQPAASVANPTSAPVAPPNAANVPAADLPAAAAPTNAPSTVPATTIATPAAPAPATAAPRTPAAAAMQPAPSLASLPVDIPRVPTAAVNTSAIAKQPGPYKVLAWNDLGMHCYNNDFSAMAVLPPYNTIWAQVVKMGGEHPQIVTSGVKVSYSFPDNKDSASKTNFWQYAKQLFGADLQPNIGLTGKGLAGQMDVKVDHFEAVGIPLTEFTDSNPKARNPYQLADIVVTDANSGAELARTQIVVPTSSEMRCDRCHSKDGIANTKNSAAATDNVGMNILALHDAKFAKQYPASHDTPLAQRAPVLCAECHRSNALGAAGVKPVSSLSNAMHGGHAEVQEITPDTQGCYNCHPGQTTQCLRDVMSVKKNFTCEKCHGTIDKVAQNPNPWLNEPRCDAEGCHQGKTTQTDALYRNSRGHQGIYCEACHDSTHAIATSRETNDAVKFYTLQGKAGYVNTCTVCHTAKPDESFPHDFGRDD